MGVLKDAMTGLIGNRETENKCFAFATIELATETAAPRCRRHTEEELNPKIIQGKIKERES